MSLWYTVVYELKMPVCVVVHIRITYPSPMEPAHPHQGKAIIFLSCNNKALTFTLSQGCFILCYSIKAKLLFYIGFTTDCLSFILYVITKRGIPPSLCECGKGMHQTNSLSSWWTKEEHWYYTIYYTKLLITECYNMLQFNYFRDQVKLIVAILKSNCQIRDIERRQT